MSMNIEITKIENIFNEKHYQGTVDNIHFSYSPYEFVSIRLQYNDYKSLCRIVDHYKDKEIKNYEESNRPKGHIVHDIKTIQFLLDAYKAWILEESSDKDYEWIGIKDNFNKLNKPFHEWEKEAIKRIENLIKAFDRQK